MDIYPSNSYRSKDNYNKEPTTRPAERTKLKQVANASKRSDNAITKALHLDNEVAESLWTYIFQGLIGPTFKDTAYKILTNIAHAVIFGNLSTDNKSSLSSGYRSYTRFSDDKPRRNVESDYGTLSKYPTCDILFNDREELKAVVSQLEDTIDEFRVVTIGDLYDCVGWETYSTYYNWGWKDLNGMHIGTTLGGYVLHMPKPMQLN